MSDVTQILQQVQAGEPRAKEVLFEAIYQELKQMAVLHMAREMPGQTLQRTALVHEAWLRLIRTSSPLLVPSSSKQEGGRRYFFAAAAEAMRRILVEKARRKQAVRHGGEMEREALHLDQLPQEKQSEELLAIHEALDHLAAHDQLKAELVKLRYFAGFTNNEAADLLGLTSKSAEKHWVYARAWLKHHLSR